MKCLLYNRTLEGVVRSIVKKKLYVMAILSAVFSSLRMVRLSTRGLRSLDQLLRKLLCEIRSFKMLAFFWLPHLKIPNSTIFVDHASSNSRIMLKGAVNSSFSR